MRAVVGRVTGATMPTRLERAGQALADRERWLPAEHRLGLPDVQATALQLAEASRRELGFEVDAREAAENLNEIEDRGLGLRADVEDPAGRSGGRLEIRPTTSPTYT